MGYCCRQNEWLSFHATPDLPADDDAFLFMARHSTIATRCRSSSDDGGFGIRQLRSHPLKA